MDSTENADRNALTPTQLERARCFHERRRDLGYSCTTIAQAVGVAQGTASRWEQGKRPIPPHKFGVIKDVLGLDLGVISLVDGVPPPPLIAPLTPAPMKVGLLAELVRMRVQLDGLIARAAMV